MTVTADSLVGAPAPDFELRDQHGQQVRTFVIDADGIVIWTVVNSIAEARDIEDYRRVLQPAG